MPELNPYEAPQTELLEGADDGKLRDRGSLQDHSQSILAAFLLQPAILWMSSITAHETFGPEGGVNASRFWILCFLLGCLTISVIAMLLLVIRFRSLWLLIAQSLWIGVPLIYFLRDGP